MNINNKETEIISILQLNMHIDVSLLIYFLWEDNSCVLTNNSQNIRLNKLVKNKWRKDRNEFLDIKEYIYIYM